MKKINKKEPKFYSDFFLKEKPTEWSELSIKIGEQIRTYILSGLEPDGKNEQNNFSEQNFQCAYTEIDIEPESSSSHIDHFCKQSMFPTLKFNWSNLFASTNNESFGAKYKDNKYRIHETDYQYLINPAIENPTDYFEYAYWGDILIKARDKNSKEYQKAKKTIDIFNLNEKSLVEQRLTVAKQVKAYSEQMTISQIKTCIGRFDSFIEYIYSGFKKLDVN